MDDMPLYVEFPRAERHPPMPGQVAFTRGTMRWYRDLPSLMPQAADEIAREVVISDAKIVIMQSTGMLWGLMMATEDYVRDLYGRHDVTFRSMMFTTRQRALARH